MSVIERALEKMQQARGAPRLDATQGAGLPSQGVPSVPARVTTPTGPTVEINETLLRAAGLLPPEHQVRQLSRQYRRIKRPLLANAFGRGGSRLPNAQNLLITSAVAGEGKTFTSINLAISMALEKDVHVVLVDADIPKSHITKLLGIDKLPGLVDTLQDSSRDIESCILPTSIRGLSVLPAGARAENATELLASNRMREIMGRMSEQYPHRIVLFDSPPLLLTTESQVLIHLVGQAAMVVRAGVTPQRAVLEALSQIGEGRYVGLILNQSAGGTLDSYYYYENNGEGEGQDSGPE